jgi:multiple antibiotic resistance protein
MQYFIQYFTRLFMIISPLPIVALFISMTAPFPMNERIRIVKVACSVAYGTMLFFAMTGQKFFEILGITIGAFYIAGGIIIFLLGVVMLCSDGDAEAPSEKEGSAKNTVKDTPKKGKMDISVTPLAIPIICGPCCITAVITLQSQAQGFFQNIVGFAAITLTAGVLYALLLSSAKGSKWLTPAVLKLSYKISGLILAALAVEMVVSGLRHSDIQILKPLNKEPRAYSKLQVNQIANSGYYQAVK